MLRQRPALQYSISKAAFRAVWKHHFTLGIPNTETFPEQAHTFLSISEALPRSDIPSIIPNQHRATSLPFQYPCGRTSAQSCCLAFTTEEEMAHGPLPEPWCTFPESFSCRGTSMSLYRETLPFHILKCCPWVRNMHTLWMRIMNRWFHYLIFQHISICAVAYGEIIR